MKIVFNTLYGVFLAGAILAAGLFVGIAVQYFTWEAH